VAVLTTRELLRRLEPTDPDPLVVAPLLIRDEQVRDGQASIDVRLGLQFRVADTTVEGVVDTLDADSRSTTRAPIRRWLGEYIVLQPHQFMLGETLEFIRLPRDLMAYVVGRSSWGRHGLVVATAVGVHPGFSGVVTLELRNLGEVPLALYPGDTIAQLFFHTATPPVEPKSSHAPGTQPPQFAGHAEPSWGTVRYESTRSKLRKLKQAATPRRSS
jgi:dCTP deaminase